MIEEVLFRGEWVDKKWLNRWLSNPENQRMLEEEKAQEKAAAEEERKKQQQLQKQKAAESRLKEKKVKEYFIKFRQQEVGSDASISDELAQVLWVRARNTVENERKDEEYRKQCEEELRQMEESEKKRQKERELRRKAIARSESPEYQIKMIFSPEDDYKTWYACRRPTTFDYYGRVAQPLVDRLVDVGAGMSLLRKEFSTGEILKRVVGQQAYNRLVEFGKPDETWEDLINRLLNTAEKANTAAKNGLTIY